MENKSVRNEKIRIKQCYLVECFNKDGKLKWQDEFDNLVVTTGRDKYLDATLKTGLTTPLWYVGLVDYTPTPSYVPGDIMSSHAGWVETVPYSNGTRPAFTPGTITSGSVDNSASKAVFNINATETIAGCFMADNSTKSGTTGTLLGEGSFTAGDRAVQTGATPNVTVTCAISAG